VDDVITARAFDKHGSHQLPPIFDSDVDYFDVMDMSEVVVEAAMAKMCSEGACCRMSRRSV
jgi:hypothetical protein